VEKEEQHQHLSSIEAMPLPEIPKPGWEAPARAPGQEGSQVAKQRLPAASQPSSADGRRFGSEKLVVLLDFAAEVEKASD
jgi:hypothetical protein